MNILNFLSDHWVAFAIACAVSYFIAGINQINNMRKMCKNIDSDRSKNIKIPFVGLALSFFFGFIGTVFGFHAILGLAVFLIENHSV